MIQRTITIPQRVLQQIVQVVLLVFFREAGSCAHEGVGQPIAMGASRAQRSGRRLGPAFQPGVDWTNVLGEVLQSITDLCHPVARRLVRPAAKGANREGAGGEANTFFFFFASASVVRRVWGTYVSRLLRQPAGVCSQAAREQLTQRHLSVVRWVAGPRDGQLEERAGVRPERCERGLGFPALVQGLASGRGAPRRPLASPCPCEQSQERQGAAADSPANFNAEDNQAAAPSLPQFRVSSVFAVDCLVEGEARLVVSPWAGLAIPSDWAHDCGVHRDLGALPYGESIGDNLYAPSVQGDFFFFRPFSLLPLASVAFTQAA